MTASSDGDISGNHTSGDLWVLELQGNTNTVPLQPVVENLTVSQDPSIAPLDGTGPLPTDPDGDGRYEDLNGNGAADLQDPTIFFQHFSWIQKQGYIYAFDFNENNILDLSDVQALFAEIQS